MHHGLFEVMADKPTNPTSLQNLFDDSLRG